MNRFPPLFAALVLFFAAVPFIFAEEILFQDDFKTTDKGWDTSSGKVSVKDGRLLLACEKTRATNTINATHKFPDSTISVTLQMASGPQGCGAGLVFWAKGDSDNYVALLGPGTLQVYHFANGQRTYLLPLTDYPEIQKTGPNALKVTTNAGQAVINVNGKNLITIKGSAPEGGSRIGLRCSSPPEATADGLATFSDLKVLK